MQTIKFSFCFNEKEFSVEFDSESPNRNLPQTVIHNGFSLDIPDIVKTYPLLYARIKKGMAFHAANYWNTVNGQITGVPTLDYQEKAPMATRAFDAMLRSSFLFCFLLLMVSFKGHAQDTIHQSKVKVAGWVTINRKTGKKTPYHLHWVKVKSGNIIHEASGAYLINGKEWKGNDVDNELVFSK